MHIDGLTNHATRHNRERDFLGNLLDDSRNQTRHEFDCVRLLCFGEFEPARDRVRIDEKQSLNRQQPCPFCVLKHRCFRRDNPVGADTFGEIVDAIPVEADPIDSLGVEEDRSVLSFQMRHIAVERTERPHHEERRRHIRL